MQQLSVFAFLSVLSCTYVAAQRAPGADEGFILFAEHSVYEKADPSSKVVHVCPRNATGPLIGDSIYKESGVWRHVVCEGFAGYILYRPLDGNSGKLDRITARKSAIIRAHEFWVQCGGQWRPAKSSGGMALIDVSVFEQGLDAVRLILPGFCETIPAEQIRKIGASRFLVSARHANIEFSCTPQESLTVRFRTNPPRQWNFDSVNWAPVLNF